MFIIIRLYNWLKRQIRDYFGFSKAETNGVLILLALIFCFLALPHGLKWYYDKTEAPIYDVDIALLDSTLAILKSQHIQKNKLAQQQEDLTTILKKSSKKKEETITHPKIPSFDINTASNKQLQILPGIGPTRSANIIKYRTKLGGFIRQEQYQEIYGLDALSIASIVQYTYINPDFQPKRININQHDFKSLLAHPYLSYEQVKLILQYRNKQGQFKYIEELLQLNILEKATFKKIKSYLTL